MKKCKRLLISVICAAFMLSGCAGRTADERNTGGVSEGLADDNTADDSASLVSDNAGEDTADTSAGSQSSDTESGVSSPDSSAQNSEADSGTSKTDSGAESSDTESDISKPDSSAPSSDVTGGNATSGNVTSTASKPESAAQSSDTESNASKPESTPQKEKFSINWKLNSEWREGDNYCGGYEVTIANNSGSDIGGWSVEFDVPSGFSATGWNGVFTISGTSALVKNADYNGSIPDGGSTGFGFNYSSPKKFTPSSVSINGSPAKSETAPAQTSPQQPEQTAPVTTLPAVTTKKPPKPDDPVEAGTTPVAAHGKLSVDGIQLVDENGEPYQLRGMSTHGLTWFPDFVNKDAFSTLRDEWGTNVVRLAMYVDEWGNGQCYINNEKGSRELLEKGVDICLELGMYVIIDWHVLNPGDPSAYTDKAVEFFDYIADKYKGEPNIIYEICNEPNGNADWNGVVKPYAETVIPVIRKHDKDAVIIVGTPTWSQDIDKALANPLSYDNIMYALHFYAATHTDWLRDRLKTCVDSGLPVFVSEFGCCDASGNGGNDFAQAEKWLSLLDEYNISYCSWSLCNKAETASCLTPSAGAKGGWSDSELSESGKWLKERFISRISD